MPYADPIIRKNYHQSYGKKWRDRNPERTRAFQRKWNLKNPEAVLIACARTRARKKGLEFTITIADIVIPDFCPVLGIPLRVKVMGEIGSAKISDPNVPSIDRINSKLGYIPGNIQIISWRANNLKKDATADELRRVAEFMTRQDK